VYNINNGENVSLVNCANTTFDVSGDGSYTLNIYANDTQGEESNASVVFSVNIGSPTIILHFPINKYLNYQENIYFNYTPSDLDLASCELWGNFTGAFTLNQTDASPTSDAVNFFILNLSDGDYLWNIRCNDSFGHSAFNGNKTFYVDTINPNVVLTQPTGSKTSRSISAEWEVSDASPVNCWYNVYRGANLEIANTSVTCSDNSTSFDVTVDADFTFYFYANDSAGNLNSSLLNFSVDTSVPSSPSSGGSSSGGGSGGGGGGIIYSNKTKLGKLSFSELGDIIANKGDKKTLSLNVKNTGRIFLNNCRLIAKGEIGKWIYSNKISGIAPGQNIDFVFDLNVPEEIESRDYFGELEIKCDEGNNIQNISVSVRGFDLINIRELVQEKDILKINYDFDNSKIIGDSVSVDIWLVNPDGVEVKRVRDSFPINKEGLINRSVELDIRGMKGIYSIYFALSSDLENFIKKTVVLGESGVTGFAVLDTFKGKFTIYIIFLILIVIGVIFIWKKHGRAEHPKNKWLFRKKK